MDIQSFFENKLKTDETGTEEFAQKWDERAKRFYEGQLKGNHYLPNKVTKLLTDKGIITSKSTLLDIGAGAGRYTIPLAKEAKSMLALDFSNEMLRYLKKVSDDRSVTNIRTRQLPWPTQEALEQVDVAFSAMCPCTRSLEALKQMSNIAREYAVITQMTRMTDNIIDKLIDKDLIEINPNDPHNNRDLTQSYFNILWELGYEPEINFIVDERTDRIDKQVAIIDYKERYDHVDGSVIEEVIERFTENEEVKIVRTTRLAVISWDVS